MQRKVFTVFALLLVLAAATGAFRGLKEQNLKKLGLSSKVRRSHRNGNQDYSTGPVHEFDSPVFTYPAYYDEDTDETTAGTTEYQTTPATVPVKAEPTLSPLTGHNYSFLVVGLDINDGKYIARVRDGKIELDQIQDSESENSADVSTTTSKYPQPEELQSSTNKILQRGQQALKQYQLSILQFRTQMNLNSLHSLLPVLEGIENSMKLLLNSSIEEPKEYSEQSNKLEANLIQAEYKLIASRSIVGNITGLPAQIIEMIRSAHQSMVGILQSQIEVLALPIINNDTSIPKEKTGISATTPKKTTPITITIPTTTIPTTTPPTTTTPTTTTPTQIIPASIPQVKEFLASKLQGRDIDSNIADRVMTFMSNRLTDETRKESFFYLFDILKTLAPTRDLLTVRAMAALQKYPAVAKKLTAFVPQVVPQIFANQGKCIMPSPYPRQMILDDTESIETVKLESNTMCSAMDWKFVAVEDGKYFVILHESRNVAVGIDGRRTPTLITDNYNPSLATNPAYHWTLALDSSGAVKFIHRTTGLLLTALDGDYVTESNVHLQPYVDNSDDQDWVIHLE